MRRQRHETAAGIPVETPSQLAERLSSELFELVDLGEISPALARRVRDDLFEPVTAEGGSSLRAGVWSRYVEELAGQVQ